MVSIQRRLSVRVVGGGPAGLEVARASAERGHRVRLYEARAEVGGRLWFEAQVTGRETVGRAAQWLEREAQRLGTQILRSSPVTTDEIRSWDPDDVVIVAIGAEPVVEPMVGAQSVVSLEQALQDPTRLEDPIAVIDEIDDEPVYAAAEMLSHIGHRVSLVTPRQQLGRHVAYVNVIGMLRRLDAGSVPIHTLAQPVRVDDGVLIGRHPFSLRERAICGAATVVRAGPYQSRKLEVPSRNRSIVVGDASSPRTLGSVVLEATTTAASL
jgi:pyruvate/2-oxoglutarate dehydrogenase complex dihydrolipoamide dehydrogenase (E3) component